MASEYFLLLRNDLRISTKVEEIYYSVQDKERPKSHVVDKLKIYKLNVNPRAILLTTFNFPWPRFIRPNSKEFAIS